MINIDNEELLTLKEVARLFPSARTDGTIRLNTVYRWVNKGFRGVRLETVDVGGACYSSREAVKRFARFRSRALNLQPEPGRLPEREARTNEILRKRGLDEAGGEKA